MSSSYILTVLQCVILGYDWKFDPPEHKLYKVDRNKEVAYSRKSMLWSSSEDHKTDSTNSSSQGEDYLYKNSDMLAEFEIGVCIFVTYLFPCPLVVYYHPHIVE